MQDLLQELHVSKLSDLYQMVLKVGRESVKTVDMTYLMGQTPSNQRSVLDMAKNFECPIGIIGHEFANSGYAGFSAWKKELLERGVTESRIVPIFGALVEINGKPIMHTLSEAQALVRHAKKAGMRDVAIIAPYWHLLRATMSAIGTAINEYPLLRIYPTLGTPLPWDEHAVHSQRIVTGARIDFIPQEIFRVLTYYQKGDLPAPEKVLEFLSHLNFDKK